MTRIIDYIIGDCIIGHIKLLARYQAHQKPQASEGQQ
jgi:hypothetical protein